MEESFLELAGGGPAARVDFAACLQPGLRETDRHPAEQAQGKGRLGVVDPAVIFPQRDVQSVMYTTRGLFYYLCLWEQLEIPSEQRGEGRRMLVMRRGDGLEDGGFHCCEVRMILRV